MSLDLSRNIWNDIRFPRRDNEGMTPGLLDTVWEPGALGYQWAVALQPRPPVSFLGVHFKIITTNMWLYKECLELLVRHGVFSGGSEDHVTLSQREKRNMAMTISHSVVLWISHTAPSCVIWSPLFSSAIPEAWPEKALPCPSPPPQF